MLRLQPRDLSRWPAPRGARVAPSPSLLTEKLTLECDNLKGKNCLRRLAGDVPLEGSLWELGPHSGLRVFQRV